MSVLRYVYCMWFEYGLFSLCFNIKYILMSQLLCYFFQIILSYCEILIDETFTLSRNARGAILYASCRFWLNVSTLSTHEALRLPIRPFSSGFATWNSELIPRFSHICYMHSPSLASLFHPVNNICKIFSLKLNIRPPPKHRYIVFPVIMCQANSQFTSY